MPLVSVVIPVFNREHMLRPAIESILAQSMTNFELVVVDDGSSDRSVEVAQSIADPRIRVVRHAFNRGIAHARNTGLSEARGDFIAWLDSDDISRPNRLATQVEWLRANPDVALIGSAAGKIKPDGRPFGGKRRPANDPCVISAWLLFGSAFQQSSIMGRVEILKSNPYDPDFKVCEDVELFVRLSKRYRLANVPHVLIDRRIHPGQTVRMCHENIDRMKMRISAVTFEAMGMPHDEEDLRRHVLLGRTDLSARDVPADFLEWGEAWLRRLLECNRRSQSFNQKALEFTSSWFWLLACRASIAHSGVTRSMQAFCTPALLGGFLNEKALGWAASQMRQSHRRAASATAPDDTRPSIILDSATTHP